MPAAEKLRGRAWVFGDLLDVRLGYNPLRDSTCAVGEKGNPLDWRGAGEILHDESQTLNFLGRSPRRETSSSPERTWATATTMTMPVYHLKEPA